MLTLIAMADDIIVYLSTYKQLLATSRPQDLSLLRSYDLPVCVAESTIILYAPKGPALEREEHHLATLCKDMAKTVHIDPKSKLVFIGEDPKKEETGLVWYIADETVNSFDFFERWEKTHCLVFEYQVKGATVNSKEFSPVFTIRGAWEKDHWVYLEIDHSGKIVIQPAN